MRELPAHVEKKILHVCTEAKQSAHGGERPTPYASSGFRDY